MPHGVQTGACGVLAVNQNTEVRKLRNAVQSLLRALTLQYWHVANRLRDHPQPRGDRAKQPGFTGVEWHLLRPLGRDYHCRQRSRPHDRCRPSTGGRRAQPQGVLLRAAHRDPGRFDRDRRPLRRCAQRQRGLPSQPESRRCAMRLHLHPLDGRQIFGGI